MTEITIPSERIISKIYIIRNKKVMLDRDIAELYGVETKNLNKAVKRNLDRFPADFMFQLNKQEMENWKSQFVISNSDQNSLRSQFVTLKGTNLKSEIVTSNSDKDSLRFQIGTLKGRGKHSKYLPYAFTEQGVAMLSGILNSDKAIEVNIQIIRTFTKLRELLATNEELQRKMMQLESRYDSKLKEIFNLLQFLLEENKSAEEIGFKYKEIK
ncbi:ORF6N domain-containing protein [Patescibacteria group bacterium]|nr:ORF6N domain-containing protein [Patescibacteria group bacterium]